ncbi:hypothetical protein [Cellulosilyticum ruminicola]|uniref:hypothetical protein n=1 Tax=Cellulosilyticum ruminicola TaxID=425254 RepID=UPI000ABD4B4A|nr:hypothetical protein [Cellulosilyticum ruminicola]
MDPKLTWLENLLNHEYTECYLYYSCYEDETDLYIKKIWEEHFCEEITHLHQAADLLKQYEGKEWQQVIPDGNFPELLKLHENKEYVRNILRDTVQLTSVEDEYINIGELPQTALFFNFQDIVNKNVAEEPGHKVIADYIDKKQMDYRYEDKENPIELLRDRKCDNTNVGRRPI